MKPKIALFMNNPVADVSCCNGMMEALEDYYRFTLFSKKTIDEVIFNKIDLVAFPGGTGDADLFHRLLRNKSNIILDYVQNGGRYLGICMGAYWADTEYLGLLDDVRVKQYIKHPTACTRRPHAKHMPINWDYAQTNMYFYDGCTFTGSNFTTIARYSNYSPMAIIQDRVGLIGCHPEAEQHWYDDYTWMAPRWSGGSHHLLVDFVENLLRR